VFGAIAGAQASGRALLADMPAVSPEIVGKTVQGITAHWNRDKGFDYREVKKEITEVMSRYAGVIRNEEGLRKALKVMDEIGQKKLDRLCIVGDRSLGEMAGLFETRNIHAVGRLILQAALLRTESRGAHNREDYPEMSDAWQKNIVFQRKAGETDVSITSGGSS
jgi:succinate dehydrogenase / fumarate reductase flavoprotein subunit